VEPINSTLLTITLYSSVITTPVYNDTKYSAPFITLQPSSTTYRWMAAVIAYFKVPSQRCINLGRLGFVRWRLTSVVPQYGSCFMSPLLRLELWDSSYIFGTFLRVCIIPTLCSRVYTPCRWSTFQAKQTTHTFYSTIIWIPQFTPSGKKKADEKTTKWKGRKWKWPGPTPVLSCRNQSSAAQWLVFDSWQGHEITSLLKPSRTVMGSTQFFIQWIKNVNQTL
jgi:hypothetical protein